MKRRSRIRWGQYVALTLAAVLGLFGDSLAQANGEVVVGWCDATLGARSGSQDTVYICVDDVTGENIISYQLVVTFDQNVLSAVGATSAGTISAGFGAPTANVTIPGRVTVGGFGTTSLAGSGSLVGIIFNIVGTAGTSSELCLQEVLLNSGQPSASIPTPCSPVCVGSQILVDISDQEESTAGQPITIPVMVDSVTGEGIISFQFDVLYDQSVIAATDASNAGTISESFTLTTNTLTPGRLSIGGFGTSPLSGSGTLLNLNFDVMGAPGDSSDLTIQNFVFNSGCPIAIVDHGKFRVRNVFDILGEITYCPNNRLVSNVMLALSGAAVDTQATDAGGAYRFAAILGNENYTITPSKTGDVGALSITCFDAALIAQIAVGLNPADHCDSLAADVDENGFIQTFDAALVCRYAVGLPPFNASDRTGEWRFEPASRSYTPLTGDQTEQNFTAVLLGDMDGNWSPASAPAVLAKVSGSRIGFGETPAWSADGKSLRTRLTYAGGRTALSFELELEYRADALRFTGARSLLDGWQVVTHEVMDGRVRVGMFSPHGVGEAGPVVELSWDVVGESSTSDVVLTRAVVDQDEQIGTSLELNPADRLPTAFQLYPNYPNPFNPETQIRFDIPAVAGESVATRLAIYNLAGQLVRILVDDVRAPGAYTVQWDGRTDLGEFLPSGMYLYKLEAGSFVATRKLALVK